MKLYLTVFFLFTNIYLPSSQDELNKVSFVSYWSNGDSYDFKITKIKQQWRGGELIKNDSTQYIANFKIIDSTASSYKIMWSYETDLKSTYNVPDELLQKFAKYKITEVIYSTSELGEFQGIENWQEIGEVMNSMFTDLINFGGGNNKLLKDKIRISMTPFIDMYSTKNGIEQLVLSELQYFHFPFGLEYDIREPIEYIEELPNMFGGAPIKGNAKLFFESVDFNKNHCVLINEMKLNPDDTKKVISLALKKMGLEGKTIKDAKFNIIDENRFEYYYNPGIPIKIETKRTSIIDIDTEKGKRIDKMIIELIR